MTLLSKLIAVTPDTVRSKLACHLGAPDLRWTLTQLRRFGLRIHSAVDVGAYHGDWTKLFLEAFPESSVLCVEPNRSCLPKLTALAAASNGVTVLNTLLGEEVSDGRPFADFASGSSLLASPADAPLTPMTTLNRLIQSGTLRAPEYLKLDVQGYERQVMQGWTQDFEVCQVIQCELSLLPLVPGAPLLPEMLNYLQERGFVMWEVEEMIRAPSDGALWQVDALFVRENSPLRTERRWR